MKHSVYITLILIGVFFVSQIVGLAITQQYLGEKSINSDGEVVFENKDLPLDIERPQVEATSSVLYIMIAVIFGTVIVLLLIKFRSVKVWKAWFTIAVSLCLIIALSAFLPEIVAIILGIGIALWKIFKPNFIIHNISEVFIYGGLAGIFVPIMNIWAAVLLLVLISIYDMIAVWQSKHMVKMAKFQTEAKVFAGLSIPYKIKDRVMKTVNEKKAKAQVIASKKSSKKKSSKKSTKKLGKTDLEQTKYMEVHEEKSAILGGGDIGFPLLFTGVVMKTYGMLNVLIISVCAAISLFLLLYFAKKDRFYPAMPYLSAGCFIGYGVMYLVTLI